MPEAIVAGAGIAGATVAWTLAEAGWSVTVLEQAERPGQGGSGNPHAILYPKLVSAAQTPAHLQSQGWLRALERLSDPRLSPAFTGCGVLWLEPPRHPLSQVDSDHPWWQRHVWRVDAAEATALAGVSLDHGGLWFPAGGVIDTRTLLDALLTHPGITVSCRSRLQDMRAEDSRWRLTLADGRQLETTHLVLAQAGDVTALPAAASLPLKPVRGQISLVPASLPLRTVLCQSGYLTPALAGQHSLGATFQRERRDLDALAADQIENRERLATWAPGLADQLPDTGRWHARAGVRWQTPDYQPLGGLMEDERTLRPRLAATVPGKRIPPAGSAPALAISAGHGAKGYSQAWLAADVILAQFTQPREAWPMALVQAMDPERFLRKAWKRGELRLAQGVSGQKTDC